MTGEEVFILCCAILAVVFMVIVAVTLLPEHKRTFWRIVRNIVIVGVIVLAFILCGIYITIKINEPEEIETVH